VAASSAPTGGPASGSVAAESPPAGGGGVPVAVELASSVMTSEPVWSEQLPVPLLW
jgi:hypothetical protein